MKPLLIACGCMGLAVSLAAQDRLSAARDLYAAAAYEDALTTLGRANDGASAAPSAGDIERVEEYKAFCLFALGRNQDAQSIAEGLIGRNPLLQVDADASPRIAAMFADVRKKLMPSLVRERYRTARAAIDRKEYSAAEPQLTYLRRMLDEADKIGAADETMGDLRVLVDGFMELTRAAAAPTIVAAAPSQVQNAAATAAPSRSDASAQATPRLYDSGATDVVPPVTIRQEIPMIPRELTRTMLTATRNATLEVLVDENGNVERAVMREPLNPIYDRLVVTAARTWKYRPAMKGTTAVKYLKMIGIVVSGQPAAPPQDGQPG